VIEWTVDVESNVTTYDEYSYYVHTYKQYDKRINVIVVPSTRARAFTLEA
jgi:hypothetical protein